MQFRHGALLQVMVAKVWNSEVTVQLPTGNRESIRTDGPDIIEVTPEQKRSAKRGLFDKAE